MRIFSLLTGGIDLPKLEQRVLHLDAQHSTTMHLVSDARGELFRARGIVPNEDRQFGDPYETRYESLSDRLDAIENLIASRALAEDVETLRVKLDRVDDYTETTSEELHDAVQKLATIKANHEDIAALRATVAGLAAKVEALTAAKLSDVRSRKKAS
nr:hypothetical protein [uncultured Brevundimonas sp.]